MLCDLYSNIRDMDPLVDKLAGIRLKIIQISKNKVINPKL